MKRLILLLMCCCLTLCGCWNYKEVKDFTVVMGIGIDEGKSSRYKVSVEIAQMKSGGEQVRDEAKPKILSVEGDTVLQAIQSITATTGGNLYFDNCKIILLGESISKKGIDNIVEYFVKTAYFQKNIDIALAAHTDAEQLFSIPPTNEEVISVELANSISSTAQTSSTAMSVTPYQLYNAYKSDKGSVITALNIEQSGKEKTVMCGGYGCFNKLQLTGYLTEGEALFYNFAKSRVAKGQLSVKSDNKVNGFEIIDAKARVKNDILTVTAHVSAYDGDYNVNEQMLNKYVEQNAENVISKMTGGFNCNAFDFSKNVKIKANITIRDRRLAGMEGGR